MTAVKPHSSAPSLHAEGNEFVSPGDYVNEGDTICIIEAMKIMNEITAPKSGVIKEIKLKTATRLVSISLI